MPNVEDLLHAHASEIHPKKVQQLRAFSNWQWHVDERFVKIKEERHYLWRAVDNAGEVLESVITKRRNKHSALKMLRKLMCRYGHSKVLVTDRIPFYCAALHYLGRGDLSHTGAGLMAALRIHTCRSDDENGQCSATAGCEDCVAIKTGTHQSDGTLVNKA